MSLATDGNIHRKFKLVPITLPVTHDLLVNLPSTTSSSSTVTTNTINNVLSGNTSMEASPLRKLPRELRDNIYSFALQVEDGVVLYFYEDSDEDSDVNEREG